MKNITIFFLILTAVSIIMSGCMLPIFGNKPPVIESFPKETATEGVLYTYQIDVNDDTSDKLIFSLTYAPEDMTIDSSLGLIMWTPTESQIGEHEVSIQVSDGWYKATQEFFIEVSPVQLSSISVEPTIMSFTSLNSNWPIVSIVAIYSDGSSTTIEKNDCVYESSNSNIATISLEGIVTSKSNGSATVTVSYTTDGITKTDMINVTVNYSPPTSGG